jgi:hypothetical protein
VWGKSRRFFREPHKTKETKKKVEFLMLNIKLELYLLHLSVPVWACDGVTLRICIMWTGLWLAWCVIRCLRYVGWFHVLVVLTWQIWFYTVSTEELTFIFLCPSERGKFISAGFSFRVGKCFPVFIFYLKRWFIFIRTMIRNGLLRV